jgi:Flp pilus assembly protein TadG
VRRNHERGSSLVFLAVCAAVLLGSLGLAFDLGRRFIVQTELQSFVDAAALAAIYQLDGTQRGIQTANSVATSGPFGTRTPTGYYFDSKPVTGVQTLYATTLNGPYDDYATAVTPPTNTYAFVKVTVSAGVPVSFLPVISGIPTTMNAVATATAGQMAKTGITYGGSAPFMPDAHDATDTTNFGFRLGGEYTLKWGNSGSNAKGKGKGNTSAGTDCADDLDWDNPNPTSQHGFVDIGQGNSNAGTRSSIVYGGYPNPNTSPASIGVGTTLEGVPGNRGSSIFDALQERVNQDTDRTSTTYAQYAAGGRGNGRRIVTVPIGDPSTWSGNGNGSFDVVGFANFFLETSYSGTSGPICAIYIGPANLNGTSSGKTDLTKVYFNVLYK